MYELKRLSRPLSQVQSSENFLPSNNEDPRSPTQVDDCIINCFHPLSTPSIHPLPIIPFAGKSPFANLSPIAFGTLNPSYDETPNGLANILTSLPKGTLIDTAEKYGTNDGDAESALGAAMLLSGRTFRHDDDVDESHD